MHVVSLLRVVNSASLLIVLDCAANAFPLSEAVTIHPFTLVRGAMELHNVNMGDLQKTERIGAHSAFISDDKEQGKPGNSLRGLCRKLATVKDTRLNAF